MHLSASGLHAPQPYSEVYGMVGKLRVFPLVAVLWGAALMVNPWVSLPASAQDWDVLLLPASLSPNRIVNGLSGHVQPLVVTVQASREVQSRGPTHGLLLDMSLPPGTDFLGQGGQYDVVRHEVLPDPAGRTVVRMLFLIRNDLLNGLPGERPISEWKTHTLFVRYPAELNDPEEAFVHVKLEHSQLVRGQPVSVTVEKQWPLQLYSLEGPKPTLQRTWVGLWDYTLARASEPEAANGIGDLLAASGVNFIQRGDGPFYAAMRERAIRVGGNVHHAHFYSPQCPDQRADGSLMVSDYADPQCVLSLPAGTEIPGVAQLVEAAAEHDNWATIDYEPGIPSGFSQGALAQFARRTGYDEKDVAAFRQAVTQHGRRLYLTDDPKLAEMYAAWVDFRSDQVSRYIHRLATEMKIRHPDGRLAVTVNDGTDREDLKARGFGYVAADIASHVDAIMPQIYQGYDGTAVKHVMERVTLWRAALDERRAAAELVPILLVRYAGAAVFNSPARVRQQIIATLAAGADGFLLYFPANMDAPYWQMLRDTTREIAMFEAFYHDGKRVEGEFLPLGMPGGAKSLHQYPDHLVTVEDPDWAYTAHVLHDRYLLTVFNLHDDEELTFTFALDEDWQVDAVYGGVSGILGEWKVGPQDIGFVLLSQPSPRGRNE